MTNSQVYTDFYSSNLESKLMLYPVFASFANYGLFPLSFNFIKLDELKTKLWYWGFSQYQATLNGNLYTFEKVNKDINLVLKEEFTRIQYEFSAISKELMDYTTNYNQLVLHNKFYDYTKLKHIMINKDVALQKQDNISINNILHSINNITSRNIQLSRIDNLDKIKELNSSKFLQYIRLNQYRDVELIHLLGKFDLQKIQDISILTPISFDIHRSNEFALRELQSASRLFKNEFKKLDTNSFSNSKGILLPNKIIDTNKSTVKEFDIFSMDMFSDENIHELSKMVMNWVDRSTTSSFVITPYDFKIQRETRDVATPHGIRFRSSNNKDITLSKYSEVHKTIRDVSNEGSFINILKEMRTVQNMDFLYYTDRTAREIINQYYHWTEKDARDVKSMNFMLCLDTAMRQLNELAKLNWIDNNQKLIQIVGNTIDVESNQRELIKCIDKLISRIAKEGLKLAEVTNVLKSQIDLEQLRGSHIIDLNIKNISKIGSLRFAYKNLHPGVKFKKFNSVDKSNRNIVTGDRLTRTTKSYRNSKLPYNWAKLDKYEKASSIIENQDNIDFDKTPLDTVLNKQAFNTEKVDKSSDWIGSEFKEIIHQPSNVGFQLDIRTGNYKKELDTIVSDPFKLVQHSGTKEIFKTDNQYRLNTLIRDLIDCKDLNTINKLNSIGTVKIESGIPIGRHEQDVSVVSELYLIDKNIAEGSTVLKPYELDRILNHEIIKLSDLLGVDTKQRESSIQFQIVGVAHPKELYHNKFISLDTQKEIDIKIYFALSKSKTLYLDTGISLSKQNYLALTDTLQVQKQLKENYFEVMQSIETTSEILISQQHSLSRIRPIKFVDLLWYDHKRYFNIMDKFSLQNIPRNAIIINGREFNKIKAISLMNEFIFTDMYRRWYFLSDDKDDDGPYDYMILPSDFPYSQNPEYGVKYHPFPFGGNEALREIPVSVKKIENIVQFGYEAWNANIALYSRFTPEQALTHFVNIFYDWLSKYLPEKTIRMPTYYQNDIDKDRVYNRVNSHPEEYWRIYRWIRWYAEGIILNVPSLDKSSMNGNIYIKKLLDDLVKYFNDHHGTFYGPDNINLSTFDKVRGKRHKWLEVFKKL